MNIHRGIVVALGPFYLVREQSVAIIERFGRYHKTSKAGVHLRIPLGVDNIAARIQLRMLQSENVVDDIRTQMLSALKGAGTTATAVERTHDLEQVQGE